MAISKYNHALDHTVLALAAAANGDYEAAGKLLVKASKQHDVKAAVAILEVSNDQAFKAVQAAQKKVQAAAKPAAASAKVGAAARIAAKTKVKAFDLGDEAEINQLVDGEGDDFEAVDEDEVVEEAAIDEDEDGDEDGEAFDNAFASVLAGMKGKPAKTNK